MATKLEKLQERNVQLEKSLHYLQAVNRFSSELLDVKTVEDIAWIIACHISESFEFEDCVVYFLNEKKSTLEKVASYYPSCEIERMVKYPLEISFGEGLVGTVALTGKPILVDDTSKEEKYIEDEEPRLSELTVPIMHDGQLIGVVDSENKERNFYSEEHLETLQAIANLASAKIANLLLQKTEEDTRHRIKTKDEINNKILSNALDAVVSISSKGKVTFWNLQAEQIFGWTAKEAVGSRLSDLIVPLEMREMHETGMARYVKTGKSKILDHRIEIEALRKDQSTFPVELTIIPIKIQEELSFSAFIRDITEQKKNRENLERQYLEIEKINIDLDRFVHGISHDLKSPVANLEGLFSLLEKSKGDVEMESECHGMIVKSLDRMKNLMEDLLAYSKNSNLELTLEELNLKTLISGIVDEHRFMEHADRIKFEIDIEDEQSIMTDRTRFRIVLSNLISNAIKYQDLERSESFVHICSRLKKGRIDLVVEDNGLGMPKEELGRVFEMFYRCQSTTKIAGSGLGLYILKETIDKIGGSVDIESSPGNGTKVTTSFPINSK